MSKNALMINEKDSVVTIVEGALPGEEVAFFRGNERCCITAAEEIPPCHKMAVREILKGDAVIKYGEIIGKATADIQKGGWVSHYNLVSIPRNYDEEMA